MNNGTFGIRRRRLSATVLACAPPPITPPDHKSHHNGYSTDYSATDYSDRSQRPPRHRLLRFASYSDRRLLRHRL